MLRVVFVQASKIEVTKESENAAILFIASPESMALAGGVWGGSRRPAIADVLAVAKPRGILLFRGDMRSIAPYCGCLARAKHRGLMPVLAGRSHAAIALPRAGEASRPFPVRFGWLSRGVMKPEWSLRNGAKITSQVSANGRAESSPFQGGVRHGGIDAGKFLRRGWIFPRVARRTKCGNTSF